MLKKIHIPWRCLVALLATQVAGHAHSTCELGAFAANDEASSLLQFRNDSLIVDIVATLQGAKKFCFERSADCFQHLSKYRSWAWPRVRAATGSDQISETCSWMPSFWRGDDETARLPCKDQEGELVIFYRHVWKSGGWTVFENLRRVEGGFDQRSVDPCFDLDPENPKHFSFTFVRDPISRFVSAYAEVEHRILYGNYETLVPILNPFETGSLPRAEAFFQEFLKNGINGDGHLKPQIEYFGPRAGDTGCSKRFDFLGHTENFAADWSRMLGAMPCQTALAFDGTLHNHSHDPRNIQAVKALLKPGKPEESTGSLMQSQTNASELRQGSVASMEQMLGTSPQNLRALCWIYLPDFVIFGYDLPQACLEDSTLQGIVQRSQQ